MREFLKYCQFSFIILLMGCAVANADMGEIESISPKGSLRNIHGAEGGYSRCS